MKRKFLSVLFALVLALSFSLVTAVPAAADPDTLNVIPFTVNDDDSVSTATWDTTQQHSGSSSVELVNPDVTVDANFAEVFFGVDIALGDIVLATTSFWAYSTDGDFIPYFIFEIPGSYRDSGVLARISNDAAPSTGYTADWAEFHASTITGSNWQVDIVDVDYNSVGTYPQWKTWAELVNDYGALIVNCVVVELSAITVSTSVAHTVYVDDVTVSGTTYDLEGTAADYTTIQAAINAAGTGDTISVAAGTYNTGSSESFPITVNTANLTIQAASSPVIDGGGTSYIAAVRIQAADVTFQGFTIQNFISHSAHNTQEAAVVVEPGADGSIIKDNVISDIVSTEGEPPGNVPSGIGIDVHASNVEVTNNIVHDVGSIGIRVRHDWDTAPTVSNNVLLENNEVYRTANTGVLVTGYAKGVTIRQNEIYESLEPTPYNLFVHYGAEDVLIENNNIHDPYDSAVGNNVVLAGCDNVTISGNTITGATLGKNIYILSEYNLDWTGDYELLSTNVTITNNDIQNGKWGVRITKTLAEGDVSQMASTTTINYNNISGNTEYGVENTIATDVDAYNNWWGNASGPSDGGGAALGTGDAVNTIVDPAALYGPTGLYVWLGELNGLLDDLRQLSEFGDATDLFAYLDARYDGIDTLFGNLYGEGGVLDDLGYPDGELDDLLDPFLADLEYFFGTEDMLLLDGVLYDFIDSADALFSEVPPIIIGLGVLGLIVDDISSDLGRFYAGLGAFTNTNVNYAPWLLEEVVEGQPLPDTYDMTLALKDGWTLVSTDKEVTTTSDWVGTNELSPETTVLAYGYALEDSALVFGGASASDLESVSALYVKTDGGGGVGINYSAGAPTLSEKMLWDGWNLISSATWDSAYLVLSSLRYVQIGQELGPGLATLVSQEAYNQFSRSFNLVTLTEGEWAALRGIMLSPFDGYWVYMNADKSFGVIPD